jgi:triosephosphate isomerase
VERDAVVIGQVRAALKDLRPVGSQRIIVAYEPRWVIGTGQAVSPEDAASMHFLIQETLSELFPRDIVEQGMDTRYAAAGLRIRQPARRGRRRREERGAFRPRPADPS